VELIRGGGGDFIVIADGKELWNKRQMDNEFPDNAVILARL
jgi:predicted Rdx family selenoprotein